MSDISGIRGTSSKGLPSPDDLNIRKHAQIENSEIANEGANSIFGDAYTGLVGRTLKFQSREIGDTEFSTKVPDKKQMKKITQLYSKTLPFFTKST